MQRGLSAIAELLVVLNFIHGNIIAVVLVCTTSCVSSAAASSVTWNTSWLSLAYVTWCRVIIYTNRRSVVCTGIVVFFALLPRSFVFSVFFKYFNILHWYSSNSSNSSSVLEVVLLLEEEEELRHQWFSVCVDLCIIHSIIPSIRHVRVLREYRLTSSGVTGGRPPPRMTPSRGLNPNEILNILADEFTRTLDKWSSAKTERVRVCRQKRSITVGYWSTMTKNRQKIGKNGSHHLLPHRVTRHQP